MKKNCTIQNNLPVLVLPSTTIQFREVISKSDYIHYTAIQKTYIFQKSLSYAFRQIFYSVLVSLLEKREKSLGSYLACVKYQRNRNKFSFTPQYTQYSSKKIQTTPRNNRSSRK